MSYSHSPTRYVPVETRDLKHSPNCFFYVNGDEFFPGSRLCISNRIRTFDGVKDVITETLFTNRKKPGAVRNIFTPTHGRKINSISELEDGQHYVAALSDKFQPLPYRDISERTRISPRGKGYKKIDINKRITPVQHAVEPRYRNKSGRSVYLNEHCKAVVVRVHVNHFFSRAAHHVLLGNKALESMDGVRKAIGDTLHVKTDFRVFRVINGGGYLENFIEIHDASEISHNDHLLVYPRGDRELCTKVYSMHGLHNFVIPTSRRSGQFYLFPSFPPAGSPQYKHNNSLNRHKPLPSIGSSSKQSDAVSPFSNPPSHRGRGGQQSKGRAQNVDYDKDDAGLFRAKAQNNTRGAQQVKETRDTHTERPIDQMEAEEVEEERIKTEKGTPIPAGTELNKQPSVEQKQIEKGTYAKQEVNTNVKNKEVDESEGLTYRVAETSPRVGFDEKGENEENEFERVKSIRDQDTDASIKFDDTKDENKILVNDNNKGQTTDDWDREPTPEHLKSSGEKDIQDSQFDQTTDESKDLVVDNDKGQTTNDLDREATPEHLKSNGENDIQNHAPISTVSPDKRSIGSQANTPPNKTRDEERNQDDGIHRIDEFGDESFGDDRHYGRNSPLNKSVSNNPRASTPHSGGESRRKEQLQRENEAATIIQAGARGYKVRKDHRQMVEDEQRKRAEREMEVERRESVDADEETRKREEAATKIQAGVRGYQTRKAMDARKAQVSDMENFDKNKNEQDAAVRIQAGYRGYKTRKDYNTRKTFSKRGEVERDSEQQEPEKEHTQEEDDSKQHEAASRIQAGYHGYKVRKEMKAKRQEESYQKEKSMNEEKAAVTIQAGYKGYKTRKAYASRREARAVVNDIMTDDKLESDLDTERRQKAATTIQANYKGYRTRKDYASKKDEVEKFQAASLIQAGIQGYQTRKQVADQKRSQTEEKEKQDLAATRIQAGYRGYKTRKEIKSKVMERLGEGDELVAVQLPDSVSFSVASELSKCGITDGSKQEFVSKLQACFRGYNIRKIHFLILEKRNAATKIQAACESYKMRVIKGYTNKKIEFEEFTKYKAALKIRSIFNGYLERKVGMQNISNSKQIQKGNITKSSWIQNRESEVFCRHTPQGPTNFETSYWEDTHIKMYSDQLKNEAVSKVQAAFFSFYTRKKYYAWKARQAKQLKAANTIKACVKGYVSRKRLKAFDTNLKDEDEFAKLVDPKSAVEIYGRENDELGSKLNNRTIEKEPMKEHSEQESGITENTNLTDSYQREKSLGYETVSASGEVEKEGDSVREIEDEAGEISTIEKHVYAISSLQSAFRAYRMRKEFQELLSGGGELIDIVQVDRAISALRNEFRFRSAKARRLESHQFGAPNSDWWVSEIDHTATDPSFSQTISNSGQKTLNGYVIGHVNDENNDEKSQSGEQSDDVERQEVIVSEKSISRGNATLIQAAFKGHKCRKKVVEDEKRKKIASTKIASIFNGYITRKYEPVLMCAVPAKKGKVFVSSELDSVRSKGCIIQAAAKSFLHRKYLLCEKKNQEVAGRIQIAFRAFSVRRAQVSERKGRKTPDNSMRTISVYQMKTIKDLHNNKNKITVIQAGGRGHLYRTKAKRNHRNKAISKIQTAFNGFKTRAKELQEHNVRVHIENMNTTSSSATKLQAAVSGFQTRKVFISLTKLVENSSAYDVCSQKLERMGSLSETDDFKLRHKSIAKIQTALEEHRHRTTSGIAISANGNCTDTTDFNASRQTGIHKHVHSTSLGPVKGRPGLPSLKVSKEMAILINDTAKKDSGSTEPVHPNVSKIEKYIKLNMAASFVQASLRGFIARKVNRQKSIQQLKRKHASVLKSDQRVVSTNAKQEVGSESKIDKDVIRSRTASVKLEAVRRKEIKRRVTAKECTHAVKSKAERLRAEKENELKSKVSDKSHISCTVQSNVEKTRPEKENVNNSKVNNMQHSSREFSRHILQPQSAVGEFVEKKENAYEAQRELHEAQIASKTRGFDKEYETWKQERIDAAVMIQSGWRGYRVRKDILRQEETAFDSFEGNDKPKKLIVINLGRSSSEIARAEQRYNNSSMIQMAYRTCKVRRKIKIKMAVSRYERNQAVTKLQAHYRSYSTRKHVERRKVATRLQAAFRGRAVRLLNETEKLMQKHKAIGLIQAACKAFLKRKQNETAKETRRKEAEINRAALTIQTGYRGFIERKRLIEIKLAIQRISASRIQTAIKGALYRKNMKDKRNAASYVLSAYRSYKMRREIKLFKDEQKARRMAITEIQAAYRAYIKRTMTQQFKERMTKENKATSIIQCTLRGKTVRKKEKIRKKELEMQESAAVKIQSFYRGHLGRKMARVVKNEKVRKENLFKQRNAAAIKIQSVYRGRRGRKIAHHKRYIQEIHNVSTNIINILIDSTFAYLERKSVAAIRLHWSARGHMTRMRNIVRKQAARVEAHKKKLRMDKAATVIQAAVRAKRRRTFVKEANKLNKENKSAIKIQSLYRGYSVRLELEREKSKIANLSPPVFSPVDAELLRNAEAIIAAHKRATCLQAAFRAKRIRSETRNRLNRKLDITKTTPRRANSGKSLSREDAAAVTIQKSFRGYSDRILFQRKMDEKRKNEKAAADIIKASVNGFISREKKRLLRCKIERVGSAEVRKQKHIAANVVATVLRGYRKRKHKVSLRAEM